MVSKVLKPTGGKRAATAAKPSAALVAKAPKLGTKAAKAAGAAVRAISEPGMPMARKPAADRTASTHWQALARRAVKPIGGLPTISPTVFTSTAVVAPKRVLSFSAGLEPVVYEDKDLSRRLERLVHEVTFTVAPKTQSRQAIQEQRGLIGTLTNDQLDGLRPDDKAADLAVTRLQLSLTASIEPPDDRVNRATQRFAEGSNVC
jgi:hypothetical protein